MERIGPLLPLVFKELQFVLGHPCISRKSKLRDYLRRFVEYHIHADRRDSFLEIESSRKVLRAGTSESPQLFRTNLDNLARALRELRADLTLRPVYFILEKKAFDISIEVRDANAHLHLSNARLHLQHRREPHISRALESIHAVPDHFPGKFELLSLAFLFRANFVSASKDDVLLCLDSAKRAVCLWNGHWEAHARLGSAHACLSDWNQAHQCFSRAIECNSASTLMSDAYGIYLVALGRFDEILNTWTAALNRQVASPPADRFLRESLMQIHYMQGSHLESHRALALHGDVMGDSWLMPAFAAILNLHEPGFTQAIACLRKAHAIAQGIAEPQSNCIDRGLSGAIRLLTQGNGDSDDTNGDNPEEENLVARMIMMFADCALGRTGQVLSTLLELRRECYPSLSWLLRYPCILDLLRDNPHFRSLWRSYYPDDCPLPSSSSNPAPPVGGAC